MSGCEKYQELISRLIDDELDFEERSVLAEHLKSCRECTALYSLFSGLSDSLSEQEEPPEQLHENIMAEIRRSEIKKKNRKVLSKQSRSIMAAAACFVLLIGASFGLRPLIRAGASAPMYNMSAADEAVPQAPAAPQPAQYGVGGMQAEPAEASDEYSRSGEATVIIEDQPAESVLVNSSDFPAAEDELPTYVIDGDGHTQYFELTEAGEWEELTALFAGKRSDISSSELSAPDYIITVDEGAESRQLNVFVFGDKLYYVDPYTGSIYLAECCRTELDTFLHAKK